MFLGYFALAVLLIGLSLVFYTFIYIHGILDQPFHRSA
jgi:hypothetical protein